MGAKKFQKRSNSKNDRVRAPNRAEADRKSGVKRKYKFPTAIMVWLGVCTEGVTPLVIFENGSIDHEIYIKEVLPVAKNYGDKLLGTNWTFQQNNAPIYRAANTQKWCRDNMPEFIPHKRWSANNLDLNPLDYCIWDEFNQWINWGRVQSKSLLIDKLKAAVKKFVKM